MDDQNSLGDYLRARRELVKPQDVGLRPGGVRRVAGLRREEVATLAGISSDYYLRLEQGRDRNPSVQVLEALARVLLLDQSATEYLVSLSQDQPRRPARASREIVPPSILQLLDTIGLPAFVEGRWFDVLVANPLAIALSPAFAPGHNRIRSFFTDPAERDFYVDWEKAADGLVAAFRASVGLDAKDPRFVQLVGELSIESETFRRLWARHDVRIGQGGTIRMRHPEVGLLDLSREKLLIPGENGMLLAVYHAEPGSESAAMLGILGSLSAGRGVEPGESGSARESREADAAPLDQPAAPSEGHGPTP
ncbi:helix-turn-helix transcriptional regulator [Frondihabitans peucedani]|uniref:Helix-turn-helix transcriptional regulator n=1 Tax=Frondihabitans peucedani TaxID=598626 RepID=A0ABP8E1L1_9MICO